ncbi:MAG: hypothetical protein HY459_03810 [Parcubacteria group bacterium]|nr:hypothetical protein [Parcubacteria group bacterium]
MPPSLGQLIFGFFDDWYYQKPRAYWRAVLGLIASVDRDMAVAVMVRLFFTPLYGDYSGIGRVVGPLFRLLRIIAGMFIYLLILLVGTVFFLIFIVLPALAFTLVLLSL